MLSECQIAKLLVSGCDAELLGVSSGSKLFALGTLVVLCGLSVKLQISGFFTLKV